MASEELVTEQFQFLGIDVQNEVLTKCASLCAEYDVDAESFTEQWMAFSLNHLNGASPNLENLDLFARKEFSKRSSSRCNASAKDTARAVTGASLTVYGTPSSNQSDNDVLSNYMAVTPKRVKIEPDSGGTQQNDLRPATYSPTVGSTKYSSRTNMGTVVHSYGDENMLQVVAKPSSLIDAHDLKISQVPNEDGEIYTKGRFGFALLHETAAILGNHMRYISQHIMKKAGITESTSVRHKSQTEVAVSGRIECDADARLNVKSVVLQGTWAESLYQAVPVDIDNLKQYSLFPGQVVVMKGINPRGDKFIASEVLCDASQAIPDHRADMMNLLTGNVSMVISSGPYTTSDNMNYEPLKDLLTYINSHKPHLVVMTGPFMDCEHSMIKDSMIAETYSAFFDKIMDSLAELSSTSPNTKVYIVSSSKDACQVDVYPTPPYSSGRKHPNIHFVSDPCTLNVNGVLVGVTSCDVLMQISQEEISAGIPGDKLSRLSRHVLWQQTYWPAWPSALATDARLWAAHAQLPCTPHMLILPSNFRYFVKNVDGCVVVNPEHLTKGTGGGTFARVLISSGNEQDLNIAAQIVRI